MNETKKTKPGYENNMKLTQMSTGPVYIDREDCHEKGK